MRYVEVGGLRLSVIGLGTWQFGFARVGVRSHLRERHSSCHCATSD